VWLLLLWLGMQLTWTSAWRLPQARPVFGVTPLPGIDSQPSAQSVRRGVKAPDLAGANPGAHRAQQRVMVGSHRAIGIGYRPQIDEWTRANLARFDMLEITLDHCMVGSEAARAAIFDLVGQIPLTAHGIGLSIGTDAPLDLAYVEEVAAIVDRLKAPAYSEHLAFTRVPGRDLGNLLPLPKTSAVAESIIAKVRTVQSRISVPFLLENITYIFDWPDSELSDAEFLSLICRETGAGILLDVENLYLNGQNHGFNPYAFLDALPANAVKEVHVAGGVSLNEDFLPRPLLQDTHSHPVPEAALDLLDYALARQAPTAIVLERDDRLDAVEEILDDVARLRARFDGPIEETHARAALGSAG
jgi:uncharacterized protein (UPF0276 family)